jgi:hypothetical protein
MVKIAGSLEGNSGPSPAETRVRDFRRMQQQIQIAWSTPKSPDFDVREFASRVLAIAKENLQRDGELVSTAFIITEDRIQCASIEFAGHEEKTAAYDALVKFAQSENALAVITCNDAFWSKNAGPEDVEAYYPGKLAAEGRASECILVTLSGPGIRNWSIEVRYERSESEIRFGEPYEESGGEIGFLEGWASGAPKLQ